MSNLKASKKMFEDYRRVQDSGEFNMFTEGKQVMEIIGCTDANVYMDILMNYSLYMKAYCEEQ